jgi:hypothetical protein
MRWQPCPLTADARFTLSIQDWTDAFEQSGVLQAASMLVTTTAEGADLATKNGLGLQHSLRAKLQQASANQAGEPCNS